MNKKKPALIVFAYNRPSHLKRVLIAIENYKINNDIYLFIDGPKNKTDIVNQKDIALSVTARFQKNYYKVIKRKKNLGLSKSIINGLNYVTKKYESVIVLEDDVIPYKKFFEFSFKALKKFKNNENIAAICGYQFPNWNKKNSELNGLILPNFNSWGWAIWSKNWLKYSKNIKKIPKIKDKKHFPLFLKKYFDPKYYNKQKRNIWTLNFMYYNYTSKKNYIFPNFSLTKNIGFDGTGVNSKSTDKFQVIENKDKKINFKKIVYDKKFIKRQNNIIKKNLNFFY
jgi:hypothetical protein